MNFKEFKNELKKMGVNDEIVEMPAATKSLYSKIYLSDERKEDLPKYVKIEDKNRVRILDKIISLQSDGTIRINEDNADVRKELEVITNDYGIEVESSEVYNSGTRVKLKRENGLIYVENTGNNVTKRSVYFDNGASNIWFARGEEARGINGEIKGFDDDKILKIFDQNTQAIIGNYPHTEMYFARIRAELIEQIGKLKSEYTRECYGTIER